MKAFKYSLQALRTLRRRHEQVALQNYAQANQLREAAAERLHSVQLELSAGWAALQERILAGATILHLSRLQSYCDAVSQRVPKCEAELRAAEHAVAAAWRHLVATRRELEVVEQHHRKQHAGYERELDRQEQKRLDEIATRGAPFAPLSFAPAGQLWN